LRLKDIVQLQEVLPEKLRTEYMKQTLCLYEKQHGKKNFLDIWGESSVDPSKVLMVRDKQNFLKEIVSRNVQSNKKISNNIFQFCPTLET
jgi:hypothetical protein